MSVGETLTTRALVSDLKARYPELRIFVSTTTVTGNEVARKLADVDGVFAFPLDFGFAVRRTLDVVRPRLFVMMETEIWPTLLRHCRAARRRHDARQRPRLVALLPRATRWRGRSSAACSPTSTGCACRATKRRAASSTSAPTAARVTVTGSLKFDSLRLAGRRPARPEPRPRAALLPRRPTAGRSSSPRARCAARSRRRSRPSGGSRRAGRRRC